MFFSFFVARRYLTPTRRTRFLSFVTAVSIVGIMFGTCALLISLSILEGFDTTLRSTIIDFMGHIEMTRHGRDALDNYQKTLADLPEKFPEVSAVSPFARRESIIRSSNGFEGVILKGVLPEENVAAVRSKIVEGEFSFVSDGAHGLPRLVIGERLSQKLGVGVGDSAVIFVVKGVPNINNPPVIEEFVISGLYRSGMAEYDDIYVYSSLDVAQGLLEYRSDQVTGYDILLHDTENIRKVADEIGVALGYPYHPQPVFDIFSTIFAWLDLQRMPIPLVLGLIVVVATFNVVSTLLMTVLEKTESIGVLSTLGTTPKSLLTIFVSKGVLITAIGSLLGAVLSLGFALLQLRFGLISLEADIYVVDSVPIVINPLHYIIVILGTLALAILATLVPAWIASRLQPVRALRFQ